MQRSLSPIWTIDDFSESPGNTLNLGDTDRKEGLASNELGVKINLLLTKSEKMR